MSGGSKEEAACGFHGHFPNAVQSATAQAGFGKFHNSPKFSDITLVDSARNNIPAHRLVLSAGSKRFDELLQQEQGREGAEIVCNDIESNCFHAMLKYLYTNNCDIQIHNAVKILSAAMLYGCHDLESMSNLFIHIHLDTNTCCFFFSEARKHRIEHISRKCVYIASLDFNSVTHTSSFYNLSVEDLMALLGSAKMGSLPKLHLYKAGCAWMMQDVARLGRFKDVLFCIHVGVQSPDMDNFFNSSQGASAGQQMNYADTAIVDVIPHGIDHNSDLARISSTQSSMTASRFTNSPTMSSNFDGKLNNSSSLNSNVKSDCNSDSHVDTTEPTRAASINVALYAEQLGQSPKQNNCQCSNLRTVDNLINNESTQSEKQPPQSEKDRSPIAENPSINKSKAPKPRSDIGKGKKGQPHTCQVEGCTNDLQGLKEYHNRYKICNYHLKVDSIQKDGELQRFCQQCGRFHAITEFDNKKRSCRARLRRHNERRRKRLNNGSKIHKQHGQFISFPPSAMSPQHLLYLPQMGTLKSTDAQTNGMDGCFGNDKTMAATCLQLVPAPEMDHCFMISPVNPADQQTSKMEASIVGKKLTSENDSNRASIHIHQDAKP